MAKAKDKHEAKPVPVEPETVDFVEVAPMAPEPVAAPSESPAPSQTRFRVTLPFHSTLEVEASDEAAAIAEFNRIAGIRSTDQKYSVSPLPLA